MEKKNVTELSKEEQARNLEDLQEELYEQYGIDWEELQPIINLYETATSKGRQP